MASPADKSVCWTKYLTRLPQFSILDIANYLQTYGKEKAENRGNEFYYRGYVHQTFVTDMADEFHIKGLCYRSYLKNEQPHDLIVRLQKDGKVISGNCSCKAGKGGTCNHVLALLYLVNHWSQTKMKQIPSDKTCTSLPQQWHKPRGAKILPEPAMKCTFSNLSTDRQEKRKREPVLCKLYDARAKAAKTVPKETDVKDISQQLKSRNKSIPFTYLLDDTTSTETNTIFGNVPKGSILSYQLEDYKSTIYEFSTTNVLDPINGQVISDYPRLPTRISSPSLLLDSSIFTDNYNKILEMTRVENLDESYKIEEETIGQSNNQKWFENRAMRLTASKFGDILTRKSKPSEAFLKSCFERKNLAGVSAVAHGRDKEDTAKDLYKKKMSFRLKHDVTIYECGLVVNPAYPYLGASPDGKILDKTASEPFGLMEVKCPYKYRNSTPEEASQNEDFCLEKINNVLQLKRNHGYFHQVQGQLAICGLNWCDFVVYTTQGMHVERIKFDSNFWAIEMLPRLAEFYVNYALDYFSKSN